MMKKKQIKIQQFSTGSIILAVILSVLFLVIAILGFRYLRSMQTATDQYVTSEQSAQKLQKGSDTLTEQVRLFVMTGEKKYMDGYFFEANVAKQREEGAAELSRYFAGTEVMDGLEAALAESRSLMEREYYAMRLAAAAYGMRSDALAEEVASVVLEQADLSLTEEQQLKKAQELVCDDVYQEAKERISGSVEDCVADLVDITQRQERHASSAFLDLYIKQAIGTLLLVIFLITDSVIVRRLVVNPLVSYNEKIEKDETVPVIGAAELQSLAVTYNRVFEENQETQRLLHHEAEHDALSRLLNRGAFNKILAMYQKGDVPYALILTDIDRFKNFNDSYGHAVGDQIIQKAAKSLENAFRKTDFVFRIGGDEFAIIMVDVTSKDRDTVQERLDYLRLGLFDAADGLPEVPMSIGVAFSDRAPAGASIYQNADRALYYVKEHGRDGSHFYSDVR